jgi:DDE superfamily endonuclease
MGGVCNPIVARGSAFVYPPAITRQRAGSADLGGMNPAASRAKYKTQVTSRGFLSLVRAHWRGWNMVLFEDRAGQHTAPDSLWWAECLGIEIRLLPRATPELNAMDTLWKQVKRGALGDRPTKSIDQSAEGACEYILAMRPHDRLRQAGVLSGNFWLTK